MVAMVLLGVVGRLVMLEVVVVGVGGIVVGGGGCGDKVWW